MSDDEETNVVVAELSRRITNQAHTISLLRHESIKWRDAFEDLTGKPAQRTDIPIGAVVAHFGTRLTQLRYAADMSVSQFGEACGFSPSHAYKMLGGRTTPSIEGLVLVCAVFDVKPDDLLGFKAKGPRGNT